MSRKVYVSPELPERRLTDRAVEDEHRHVGLDRLLNLDHFVEQFALLSMPPGGVDDDDVEALRAELLDTLQGDRDRVRLGVATGRRGQCQRALMV